MRETDVTTDNDRSGAAASSESAAEPGDFELRFESLFVEGRGMSFPCDAQGRVRLDALSDRARCNYLYARAVVGREYRTPAVRRCAVH